MCDAALYVFFPFHIIQDVGYLQKVKLVSLGTMYHHFKDSHLCSPDRTTIYLRRQFHD